MQLREFRPLYFHDLDIRTGDLRVRRLALNRHLPEKDWVAPHRHQFCQFLVYLTGRGNQQVGPDTHAVRPGSVFFLPVGVEHAFVETTGRRPLCLAIDLAWKNPGAVREAVAANLTRSELTTIRHALSALSRWRSEDAAVEPREAAAVLQLLDVLLRAIGHLNRVTAAASSITRRVRHTLEHNERASLAEVARQVGYHRDHLNRLLKQTAGVSLSQLRDEVRLHRAKSLLKTQPRVSDAAWEAGFSDPNYFSRWFRAQTGSSPAAWRRQ